VENLENPSVNKENANWKIIYNVAFFHSYVILDEVIEKSAEPFGNLGV